ncbi:MAG: hypothetical protein A2Z04_08620 [Chloroflexi bacterium RBG_16_57_9]|nr:MAG: hypothetical protein A2Z04_08620 [Chloroflexi bacterium RBG_16_57_9]
MSIRLRLTIWYVGLLTIALCAFGLLLYYLVYASVLRDLDHSLRTQADLRMAQMAPETRRLLVSGRVRGLLPASLNPFSSMNVFVQVADVEGDVTVRSESLGNTRLPLTPDILTLARNGQSSLRTVVLGDTRLRIYTLPFWAEERIIGIFQVATPLTAIDQVMQQLASFVASGIMLTVAAAGLIGGLMAAAALRPIDAITRTALQITRTGDLGRRLRMIQRKDEVGRLAATFNEMLDRIETLFRTQQRFIADISHELRTPLTIIRGNVDLLRRMKAETTASMMDIEHLAESLDTIGAETERMTRLVSDLLLLAQADAGIVLRKEPVEIDELLMEVYQQAQVIADGVTVNLGHPDHAVVTGDPDRLKQLLLNLADNAIKYTPKGGQVHLALERSDGWVRIAVADTGVGIPAEDMPHIFDRFYRVDKARSREKGGTGLGLAIAQWLAQVHGGRIEVHSEIGKGSTFTVWLPEATREGRS